MDVRHIVISSDLRALKCTVLVGFHRLILNRVGAQHPILDEVGSRVLTGNTLVGFRVFIG